MKVVYFVFTLLSCLLLHLHLVSASTSTSTASLAISVQTEAIINNVTDATNALFTFCHCLCIIPVLGVSECWIQDIEVVQFQSTISLCCLFLSLSLSLCPSCVPHLLQVQPYPFLLYTTPGSQVSLSSYNNMKTGIITPRRHELTWIFWHKKISQLYLNSLY